MYKRQVKATVTTNDGHEYNHIGLNEIVIQGRPSYTVHLHISIDDMPIEKFSGDGILIATPAGSTAYNYSLGGSIVDPRLKLLQVTPIAPVSYTHLDVYKRQIYSSWNSRYGPSSPWL